MFSFLGEIRSALGEIQHIAAATGISIGILAALAGLAYLDPTLRLAAIRAGIVVLLAYCIGIFCYHQGAKDVRAQWDTANAEAAKAAAQRDADAQKQAEAVYKPVIDARDKMIAELDEEVDAYDQQLAKAPDPCVLGSGPLFLRNGTAVPHSAAPGGKPVSPPSLRARPGPGSAPASNSKK